MSHSQSHSSLLLHQAKEAPWLFSYTHLMRSLAALHTDRPLHGYTAHPQDDIVHLGQMPSLTFAPREIAALTGDATPLTIQLYSLGMLGPNGPLPLHFTESVKDRLDQHNDPTLMHFLDIFHHRAMMLQYRAWSDAQAAAGLDRQAEEHFTRYISFLTGLNPHTIQQSALPSHALLSCSALHPQAASNPASIIATLTHYFSVEAALETFVMQWITLPSGSQTQLGTRAVCALGRDAVLGSHVPDRHSNLRIVLGPMPLSTYLQFVPDGRYIPSLIALMHRCIGLELAWELSLLITPESVPECRLGSQHTLGRTTWCGHVSHNMPVAGMRYFPEIFTTDT
jgi:type VI secretion system protein ImpH